MSDERPVSNVGGGRFSSISAPQAAEQLRHTWHIGMDPIEDLTVLLEDRGIRVYVVEAEEDFDACAFFAEVDGGLPVIAVRQGLPGDRQRFSLTHELGHLMLSVHKSLDEEAVVNRFAGAFLASRSAVRDDLGKHRKALSVAELLRRGLQKRTLSGEEVEQLVALIADHVRPSRPDLAALLVAQLEEGILVTGDGSLREAARGEGVEGHGVLWVLRLVAESVISGERAARGLNAMLDAGSRLPARAVNRRLRRWTE